VLATPTDGPGAGGAAHCDWLTDVSGGGEETGVVGCELKLLAL